VTQRKLPVWLSVAKPSKRTPWTPLGKFPTAPGWVVAVSVTVPVIDYVLFSGIPALSLLVAVTYPAWRRLKVTPRQSALKAEPRSLREVNDLTHHEN
jgi:hypothetical protein